MKKRGSALIVAVMLVAAIGAIAFSMGRLLFLESITSSVYENSTSAYYAAESGIEEGLLRYRYNANAEVPFTTWTLGQDNVFRNNLTTLAAPDTGAFYAGNTATNNLVNNSDQIYDLRMGFIGTNGEPYYGHDISENGLFEKNDVVHPDYASLDSTFYVPKDESLKIDLSPLTAISQLPQVSLFARFYNVPDTDLGKCEAAIEVKFIVKRVSGTTEEDKMLLAQDKDTTAIGCSTLLGVPSNTILPADANKEYFPPTSKFYYQKANLEGMFASMGVPLPNSGEKVELYIKPLSYDMAIGLASSGCNLGCVTLNSTKVMAGPYTKVQSTGYYGGVTRKLTADIDRRSGTVYDLFDYVIYNNQ